MAAIQKLLVFVTVGFAVGFLIKKFVVPFFISGRTKSANGCSEDNCKCH